MKSFRSVVMEDTEFVSTIQPFSKYDTDIMQMTSENDDNAAMIQGLLIAMESSNSQKYVVFEGLVGTVIDKLKKIVQAIYNAFISFIKKIIKYVRDAANAIWVKLTEWIGANESFIFDDIDVMSITQESFKISSSEWRDIAKNIKINVKQSYFELVTKNPSGDGRFMKQWKEILKEVDAFASMPNEKLVTAWTKKGGAEAFEKETGNIRDGFGSEKNINCSIADLFPTYEIAMNSIKRTQSLDNEINMQSKHVEYIIKTVQTRLSKVDPSASSGNSDIDIKAMKIRTAVCNKSTNLSEYALNNVSRLMLGLSRLAFVCIRKVKANRK